MQHKASFFMLAIAHFLSTFVEIFGIWVLFDRFKSLGGWTLAEMSLIYGVMHMGFATAEAFARGFDTFSTLVKKGDFDRILLRPLGTLFQIATRDVQMMRIGRFLQGLAVLSWGFWQLDLSFFSSASLVVLFATIGTTALFYGLFVIQATLSFWTTETLELMNITTYGGMETGQYPINIYNTPFRLFFTFIIPLAAVGYYPILAALRLEGIYFWFGAMAPIAGIAFLLFAIKLWDFGVTRYRSTGN
ncbi:ABC transporter permease [Criblamydia sequanensis]|uniref:ABC-type transporter, permease subunit n=1 Tax=Candidatus Criblamydia sequanensis CRIB-18 TaxID=1437425 RepID=A0A090D0Q7_9BACT|nr:ABC-2 family transporter protein [Criblamydia sequanensis]CDR33158.1 ABC-type transporter, permease subunit [Criblamydia sequanensis CRIB-18]